MVKFTKVKGTTNSQQLSIKYKKETFNVAHLIGVE
jgi:hypothetical protein